MNSLSTSVLLAVLSIPTFIAAGCSAGKESVVQPTTSNSTPSANTAAATPAGVAVRKGHELVNGVNYYYEIRGEGAPLLLLHGGLQTLDIFASHYPVLTTSRQVIAVDLHGHGRTQLGDRKINLSDQGDDMAVLVERLGFKQVDAAGYSLGAGVAFRFAVQHPEKVRRLALVSLCFSTDGFYPEMLPLQGQVSGAMADMMKDTPMYKSYVAVAPNPAEFPKLLDRLGEYMRGRYDWADDVKKLKMPVILVFGDGDMFRLEHVVEFYKLLGGGKQDAGWMREHMAQNRLAILPNVTHYDMFLSPLMASTVLQFIDDKGGAPTWAEQVAKP